MRSVSRTHTFTVHISLALGAGLALLTFAATQSLAAPPPPMNDTGQGVCYDAANVPSICTPGVGGDAGVNPRQDGRYGRDAQFLDGSLTKSGGGRMGFDYTKIANDGSVLPATTALGSAPIYWACTRDNVTGLVWEVGLGSGSGPRAAAHKYTWYWANASQNGGDAGALGTNTCGGTLASSGNQCNTANYVNLVNSLALCGASDWRLPTQKELHGIVDMGSTLPSIETNYFPNTYSDIYWSSTSRAFAPAGAWVVEFLDGASQATLSKNAAYYVRLVRP